MRLELPPMTLAQARCLRGLERGPMTAVRSAHRGWRAPDTAVGMLIGRVLAHYVPATNPDEAPTYEITQRGREVMAMLLGDPETRELVDAAEFKPETGGAEP